MMYNDGILCVCLDMLSQSAQSPSTTAWYLFVIRQFCNYIDSALIL